MYREESEPEEEEQSQNLHEKRKYYSSKRNDYSVPDFVILLNVENKHDENKIANIFKTLGWQIYDSLYSFRHAANCISHDPNKKQQFIELLADATYQFHHPKDEFVFYSFLKWCRNQSGKMQKVLILGIIHPKEIEKFRLCGANLVINENSGNADFLIINPNDQERMNDIACIIQKTHRNFMLTPQFQQKFDSLKRK